MIGRSQRADGPAELAEACAHLVAVGSRVLTHGTPHETVAMHRTVEDEEDAGTLHDRPRAAERGDAGISDAPKQQTTTASALPEDSAERGGHHFRLLAVRVNEQSA